MVQALGEFGLADEDEVDELGGRRLDVRQQADFLEQFVRQAVGLVHDEGRDAADANGDARQSSSNARRKRPFEPVVSGKQKFCREDVEEVGGGERRVAQDRVAVLGAAFRVEGGAEQGGLPGAGLAEQERDAERRGEAVAEGGQRLAMPGVEVEEARVRRELERAARGTRRTSSYIYRADLRYSFAPSVTWGKFWPSPVDRTAGCRWSEREACQPQPGSEQTQAPSRCRR